jgi:hemerythrin-like domain-containing protein
MAVQIGAKPDSGFDDPIGMLTDCHRRIEHFLQILCLVADRAAGRGMTDEETGAVEASLQYFRVGGQRHSADEEESLFPRLRTTCDGEKSCDIDGMEADHQAARDLHTGIEQLYESWMKSGLLHEHDQEKLSSMTRQLERLYLQHIRLEEQVVFPLAARVLAAETIAQMGEEFRTRREQVSGPTCLDRRKEE